MSSKLKVKVTSRKSGSGETWEAMASIPGFKATKLTRNDGTTQFTSRSAVNTAAKNRAKQLGFSDVDFGATQAAKPVAKKAAKKSAGKAKTKASSPISKYTVPTTTY